jgi:hypothetical protein
LADAALAASFDVDGVVGEDERALLMEARAVLGCTSKLH